MKRDVLILLFHFVSTRTVIQWSRATPSLSLISSEHGIKHSLAMTPPKDSHSVLKACTKVPLYNMCVTKINKHSPSLAMSAPKVKVVQSLAFLPHALLSSLSLPPRLLLSTGNPPLPLPNRKPCCPSVLGRPKPYQLWKQCLPLEFLF